MTENDKTVACPDCGAADLEELHIDVPGDEVVVGCRECGTTYSLPRWVVADWELA